VLEFLQLYAGSSVFRPRHFVPGDQNVTRLLTAYRLCSTL
jgi:hypothetical protein